MKNLSLIAAALALLCASARAQNVAANAYRLVPQSSAPPSLSGNVGLWSNSGVSNHITFHFGSLDYDLLNCTLCTGNANSIGGFTVSTSTPSGNHVLAQVAGVWTPSPLTQITGSIYVTSPPYSAKCDGTTDDTTAIQSALTAASVNGGEVVFPAGASGSPATCVTTSTLTITGSYVHIRGAGIGASIIRFAPSSGGLPAFLFSSGVNSTRTGNSIRELRINGTTGNTNQRIAIKTIDQSGLEIRDIWIDPNDGSFTWSTGIAPPTGLAVANIGTAGSSTATYEITANNAAGETYVSSQQTTTTSNATLNSSNYNQLTWTAETGATSYNIYLVSNTLGLANGKIASSVSGTTYNHQGAAGSGNAPLVNTTGSIGLEIQGRELTTIDQVRIWADVPISFEPIPYASSIGNDHTHVSNTYLRPKQGQGNPCLQITNKTFLSSFVLDGNNAWIVDRYGLFWYDDGTGSEGASFNVNLSGIRSEQANDLTGYAVYIDTLSGLYNVNLHDSYLTLGNGVWAKGINQFTIAKTIFPSNSGTYNHLTLDRDYDVRLDNDFFQTGPGATLTSLTQVWAWSSGNNATLPNDGYYANSAQYPARQYLINTATATNFTAGNINLSGDTLLFNARTGGKLIEVTAAGTGVAGVSMQIFGQAGGSGAAAGDLYLWGGIGTGGTGGNLRLNAGESDTTGGNLIITGGTCIGSGNCTGGNVNIRGGTLLNTGTNGTVAVCDASTSACSVGANSITTTFHGTMSFPSGSLADAAMATTYDRMGGTGAIGDLLYATGTAVGNVSRLADVAAGSYLRSNGTSAAPVWSTLILPNAATTGDLLYATASNTIGNLSAVTTGSFLYSQGTSTAPVWSTLTLPNAATTGDVLYANATNAIGRLADVAVGSYLRSGGTSTAPVWSTVTLPNTATTGDIWYASASNAMSALADVAAGSFLRSAGTSTAPAWSTTTWPNSATTGDLMAATSANTIGNIAAPASGQVLTSAGTSTLPAWSATPTLTSLTITAGTGTATGIVPATIFSSSSAVNSVTTGQIDGQTYTMPANTLSSNAMSLRVRSTFNHAANTDATTATQLINGNQVASVANAASNDTITCETVLTRLTSATWNYSTMCITGSGGLTSSRGQIGSQNFASSMIIKNTITGNTANGDLIAQSLRVEWWSN